MATIDDDRVVRARYVLDEETFLQASRALWREGRRSARTRVRSAIVLAALPLGAWLAMAHGMWFTFFAIMALGLLHFVFDWPLTRAFVRRNFRQLPAAEREIEWRIGKKGLKVRIAGAEWQTIDWRALTDITEDQDGFVLHQPHNVHHWLPNRAFASENDLARFRQMVACWQECRARGNAAGDKT